MFQAHYIYLSSCCFTDILYILITDTSSSLRYILRCYYLNLFIVVNLRFLLLLSSGIYCYLEHFILFIETVSSSHDILFYFILKRLNFYSIPLHPPMCHDLVTFHVFMLKT